MQGTRKTGTFNTNTQNLVEAFFLENDRLLLERRAQLRKMEQTKAALAEVSGIKDNALLEDLVKTGVTPETLAALELVPLIEVVWADGEVDDNERKAVMDHAMKQGIAKGSIEYDLLERWLQKRPGANVLEAWRHHVKTLCEKLDAPGRDRLKNELLRDVRAAAQASGGFLGFGKISDEEKAVMEKLESSFCA